MTTRTNDADAQHDDMADRGDFDTFGNVDVRAVEMDRPSGTIPGLELIDGRHTIPTPGDETDGLRTDRTLVAIRDKTDEDKRITIVNTAAENVRPSRRPYLVKKVLGEDVGYEIDGDEIGDS